MRKRKFRFLVICFISIFAVFISGNNSVVNCQTFVDEKINYTTAQQKELSEVVKNYLKASIKNDKAKIKKLITRMPKSYWYYFSQEFEKVDFNSLEKEMYARGDYEIEDTSKDFPEYVRNLKVNFKVFRGFYVKQRAARVTVLVNSGIPDNQRETAYPLEWDFYLFRDKDNKWRIFQIMSPSSELTFPM